MRKLSFVLAGAALIFMSAAWVDGQPGTEKKKAGGGGGGLFGGGGGGAQNPVSLLNRADVKKELEITDEQLAKVNPEVLAALSKVLDEKQFKRFKQINLQQRGNNAFKDEDVQKALKLTAAQKKTITEAIEDGAKKTADLGFGGGGGGNFQEILDKRTAVRKETTEKIQGSLTASQKTAWTSMVGEEFKFQQQGFGGGGIGKGKGKTKDGAKKDPPKDQ